RKENDREYSPNPPNSPDSDNPKKLDIIEERLVVDKDKIEKVKVVLLKRLIEEDVPVVLDLTEEHIDVEVKKIGEVVDKPGPAVREEGDTKIYSVYREVYVKQTVLEEEVRITHKKTRKPFHTSEKLRREIIDVERISGEKDDHFTPQDERVSPRDDRPNPRDDRDYRSSSPRSVQGDEPRFNRQGDHSGYDH